MVFFDTCIWIELCSVKSPTKSHEIRQAQAASSLLQQSIQNNEQIVTCDEQLLEIVSAVQKIKLKEYNREAKNKGIPGCGNVKEFRTKESFSDTQNLCREVVEDVLYFVKNSSGHCEYSVCDILEKIHLADINDCIYYDYCKKNKIEFYTFDADILNLDTEKVAHVI